MKTQEHKEFDEFCKKVNDDMDQELKELKEQMKKAPKNHRATGKPKGRPPLSQTRVSVLVNMPVPVKEWYDETAQRLGMSTTALMNYCLTQAQVTTSKLLEELEKIQVDQETAK